MPDPLSEAADTIVGTERGGILVHTVRNRKRVNRRSGRWTCVVFFLFITQSISFCNKLFLIAKRQKSDIGYAANFCLCILIFICFICYFLFFSTSMSFMARTFNGRPNSVINPLASLWSYISPVVKEARDSLYRLYGEVVPALMMLPL